ncbi:MAG: hypothetical protein AB8B99_06030 [Phormidesmis sp.]
MAIAPHKTHDPKQLQPSFWRIAIVLLIALTLLGCTNRPQSVQVLDLPEVPTITEPRQLTSGRNGTLTEVAPPAVLLDLNELIENKQPQVSITFPKPDQVIEDTTFTANIQLRDLSIYKEDVLGLGPHLQLSLDNQPAQAVYDLNEPIEFTDLEPGTHTLRVIAVKPWGESFKNDGAFSETTFHVFAPTQENRPNAEQPELIYNQPQGTYGAEPVLLDFYLNNAPLHVLAAEDETLQDWQIRCDINGQSFTFDQWQPIYLRGFKPGQNWIKLTLLDPEGNSIPNTFNSTVRLINYDPSQPNTLDQLMRGELPLRDVGKIADPNYIPPALPEPVQKEPVLEVTPTVTQEDTETSDDAETSQDTETSEVTETLKDQGQESINAVDINQSEEDLPEEISPQNPPKETEESFLGRDFTQQLPSQNTPEQPTEEADEELPKSLEAGTIESTPETELDITELDIEESGATPLDTDNSNTDAHIDDDAATSLDDSASEDTVTDDSAIKDLEIENSTIEGSQSGSLNAEESSPAISTPSKTGFFNRIQGVFKQISEPKTTVEAPKSILTEPSVLTEPSDESFDESANVTSEESSKSEDSALENPTLKDIDIFSETTVETNIEEEKFEADPDASSASNEDLKDEISADNSETDESLEGVDSTLEETDTDANTLIPEELTPEQPASSTSSFFNRIQSVFQQNSTPQEPSSQTDQPNDGQPANNLTQDPSKQQPSVLTDSSEETSTDTTIKNESMDAERDIRQPSAEGIEDESEANISDPDNAAVDGATSEPSDTNTEAVTPNEPESDTPESSTPESSTPEPNILDTEQTPPSAPRFFNSIQNIFQKNSAPRVDATSSPSSLDGPNAINPSSGVSQASSTLEDANTSADTPTEPTLEDEPTNVKNGSEAASLSSDEPETGGSVTSQPIPQTLTAPSKANDISIEEPTLPFKNLTD